MNRKSELYKKIKIIFVTLALSAIASVIPIKNAFCYHVSLLYGQYPSKNSHLLKLAAINLQFNHKPKRWLKWKAEIGAIEDLRPNSAHQDYVAFGPGVDFYYKNLFLSVFMSGSFISPKDSYLGGHFQFHEDLYFGIKTNSDIRISTFFKHISSAGIYTPNRGKNSTGLCLSIPF